MPAPLAKSDVCPNVTTRSITPEIRQWKQQVARQYFANMEQKSGGSTENGPEWVLADPSNHTTLAKKAVRIASQRVPFSAYYLSPPRTLSVTPEWLSALAHAGAEPGFYCGGSSISGE